MANYNTIDDIVTSVENATKLVDNTKHDDDSVTVDGVDWFTYNGNICNTIYANGNSWIGLGSTGENLKVNRRDSAMWNLWREEGTYLGFYKFLRIRWSGYSNYNSYGDTYKQTYDVLLFDTGDIMLYMVDIPTGYYNGIFSIGNTPFTSTKPTMDNRYVSFYFDEGITYNIVFEPIKLASPHVTKYLIRDGETIYTVQDGTLTEVQGTLNAELFQTYGTDTIPDGALLMTLTSPDVLCWTDGDVVPNLKATVQGIPTGEHSIVSDDIRIGHESIYGVTSIDVVASDGATFSLSFDNGAWMVYDTSSNSWVASDVGMSATELKSIPQEAWSSVVNSAKVMQLKATLDGVNTVTQVKFNFDNESPIQSLESEG